MRAFALLGCLVCPLAYGASSAQESEIDPVADQRNARAADRIERLSDLSSPTEEWEIGVPRLEADDFVSAVRAGRALDSDSYRELHAELQSFLNAPEAAREAAGADLRRRLQDRVEVNTRLGYLYAAGVYIEMLSLAGADPDQLLVLTDRVRRQRIFEADFERFERALSDSRLVRPVGDNAAYYLDRLREYPGADPQRLEQAEDRLRAALGGTRTRFGPP